MKKGREIQGTPELKGHSSKQDLILHKKPSRKISKTFLNFPSLGKE